jgi:cytochrome o ubiquinol oxidase subunit 2
VKVLRYLVLLPAFLLLGGCDWVVMNPSGDVALQQRNLILASTALMLLIIVPVIIATVIFAWRYRASNKDAVYTPEWHHSTQLEVLIWTAPLLIIIALGALTWISTHVLDPFRPVTRIDALRKAPANVKRLTVEVVSLDWKWVFFYPEQGIATVNELAAPVDVPIDFKITSATVMNTLFIPTLAGQVYAMAGMETNLSAVINHTGVFDGFSGNYSGAGFSRMNFKFHSLDQGGFDAWVAKVKKQGRPLDASTYEALAKPSEATPVGYFATVAPNLYQSILNMCVEPGKMCANEMMAIDAAGGRKLSESEDADATRKSNDTTRDRLKYDGAGINKGDEAPGATFPATKRMPETDKPRPNGESSDLSGNKPSGQMSDHGMPGMDMSGPAPSKPASTSNEATPKSPAQ